MKKITLILIVLFTQFAFSQVGVNTTTPDPSSMLDISATNKGVLVPRVSLTNVTTTMLDGTNTAATGLLIWNTNAVTVGGNGVGFYFFNGTQWMPITQTIAGNTLDQSYDQGGAGVGRIINTTDGDVTLYGSDGLRIEKSSVENSSTSLSILTNVDGNFTNSISNSLNGNSGTGVGNTAMVIDNYIRTLINNGTIFGMRNRFVLGNNSGSSISTGNIGLDNDFYSGSNTGFDIGVNNDFSINSNSHYGVKNQNSSSARGTMYGIYNNFNTLLGSNPSYGIYNLISGGSTGNKYGMSTTISVGSGGTHYGIYSDVRNTTGFAGYFLGRSSFGTGTTNRYLLPETDGTAGQVMTTDGLGNVSFQNVTGDGTGTDDQTIDNFSLNGTILRLSLEDDGQPLQTVNLASINTDDQNLVTPTLSGTTLNLNIENGIGTSIDLAPIQDGIGTDDQIIDNFSLSGTTLRLSLENDGQPLQTVNLATINTDGQNLTTPTLVGTTLNLGIENGTGTSINLAALQDGTGTDDQNIQNLAFNAITNILTVGIENGTSQTVSLAALDSGGDITAVTAGAGLTGGGTTGTVTLTAAANNGLNIDAGANNIQLGGPLVENTTITQGIYSMDINLNSTGDFAIQDNGTDVFFVGDNGNIGMGTSGPLHPLHIFDNTTTNTNAVFINKVDNTTAETSGIFIQKTSAGTGRNHAIFTDVDGTGTAQKYGIFNRITSSAAGNQYGVRNFLSGASPSNQFGTFNNIDNAGTANHYGVYNGMRGTSASNLYGTYNEFDNTSTATNSYGNFTSFSSNSTGAGTKYGTYNFIDGAAGGTHFGTYNNVNQSNGWAGYFIGRNYISDRLSIGATDNPNAALNINKNSTGTYAQIELTEAQANDGARIRFNNSAETDNNWILYGRADDTNSDSTFNIFNNVSGNVVIVNGDGRVGIMRAPATNALEVNGTASKTVAGGFVANSDSRLKKDIITISPNEALEKILKLRGVTYHWNDDKTGTIRPKELQMGFIAQEIAEVFPEKVTEDNLGFLQTAYGDYDPIVFQAIKALNDKIEKLENENSVLKSALEKVNALEAKLNQMNTK